MKASGITIKDIEWGLKDLLTVIFMRDNTKKEKYMVKGNILGLMENSMTDNG